MQPRFKSSLPRGKEAVAGWLGEVPGIIRDRHQRWAAAEQAAGIYAVTVQSEGRAAAENAARRVLEWLQEDVGAQALMGEVPPVGRMFYGQVDEWSPDVDRDAAMAA